MRCSRLVCALMVVLGVFGVRPAAAQTRGVTDSFGNGGDAGLPSNRQVLPVDPALPTAVTHRHSIRAAGGVAALAVAPVDREAVAREDEKREGEGLAPRYAIPNSVRVSPAADGTWENLGDDYRVWRLRIGSPGAMSINLGFTRYLMPRGGRLFIYAADVSDVIRPFTDEDNESHEQLWTPPVLSDDIVVELTVPTAAVAALRLELTSINVGYRGFGDLSVEKSGSCNVDVVCPEGDLWRDQIQSVAVISTGGSTFCTGFAVNNTAQDLKPYFMTANHCGISSGNAASLVTFWNYQNSTCRPPGSAASGGPGNGSLSQFQTGSFFRAGNGTSDFTLVELDDAPNPTWNVVLAGWDNSSGDSTSAVGIHHPNTDEKRISFENDPTATSSYLGTTSPGDGTHVRIIDWDLGTTEPGSSGSPVFNQDHRVVGQLHGGGAACGNNLSDYYGRFSVSWTGGGSASTRLRDWLDPGNTGLTAIDHVSTAGMIVAPASDVTHIGQTGGPFSDPSVVYTLTNPTATPLNYSVSLTASFGVLLDGGPGPITGTLPGGGGSTTVTVSLGPAIDALPAGIYVETVVFRDLNLGLDRTRVHTVEVGQTRINVAPDTGLESGGSVGGPFAATTVYTVTSERPMPVSVQVSASEPWISLNGGAGPVTLSLNGTGAFDTVTVGFSAAAEALPAGIYNGTVSFTNTSGGAGTTTRPVTLDVGRIVIPSTDTPRAIPDSGSMVSTIDVVDGFCIGDVQVDIDITHSYVGDLIVELQSPGGTTVRLHNRTGGSANDIVQRYDDAGNPPDGPGLLSDFDFSQSVGVWTLRVTDAAAQDTGTLNGWALRIAPFGGDCPVSVKVYDFPLDTNPGWTVQGQWAFGVPTGAGSNNHDPTSGYTGSNVYGYNLAGDYASNMSAAQYLTTTALDCSNLLNTRLRFQRWLGVESASYDHANIEASNNGTTWVAVWQHTAASAISDAAWVAQSIDLSAVADGQSTVYLRWGMGPTDGSVTYPGWNLDDIEIWGVVQQVDCNGNSIPDDEDIALGNSPDCNANGVPDECDVAGGVSGDCDGNGVPDECVCPVAAAPTAEAVAFAKNRFLSVSPGNAGCRTALRVTFVALPAPFDFLNGSTMWVGPPRQICENSGQDAPPSGGCAALPGYPSTMLTAALQCTPFYTDWSTFDVVHVTHAAVVPSGAYLVQAIHEVCPTADDGSYSPPLAFDTSIWGDVVLDCQTYPCGPPDGSVDVTSDVVAILDKFKNLPTAPTKARVDLSPSAVDFVIDISDVIWALDGFRGAGYPFTIPGDPCP